MKRICLLALFVFSAMALFAERYQISLSQKENDLVFILDCIKENENEFIRPVAYEKGGKRLRFNMTAYESSESRSMEFLAMVRHGGVYCVGMMADSVNHGTGYAEMTDCRSKEEAMELLYVWSAVVAHNKGNQFSMKLYPGSVFTEGLEDSARSYTFPRESGFTERIPLVHIPVGKNVYDGIKKASEEKGGGYYLYRPDGWNHPNAGVLRNAQAYIGLGNGTSVLNERTGIKHVCVEYIAWLDRVKQKRM